jgi:predicted DCC family thiol-disulfide oxidoreductase YuxK
VILFDGVCPLCNTGADWVRARDRAGNFDLLPYQAPGVAARWPDLDPARLAEEMHVVTADGRALRGADAAARVLRRLPGWGWLGWLLGARALAPFARPAYRWVARRRRFLPGAPGRCPRSFTDRAP